jgi:polar amino acid transport system substrate-binding protein
LKALSDIVGSDFRLGVQSKVSYGPIYDTLLNDPAFQTRLHTISTRTSGWKMLDAGRIDGQIADEVTGRFELRQLGLDKRVVNSGVVVSTNAATVAFSKRTTDIDFVDRFNQTYSNLVKDGTYASIERRNVN